MKFSKPTTLSTLHKSSPLSFSLAQHIFFLGYEDIVESIRFDGPDASVVFHGCFSLDYVTAVRAKRKVFFYY